MDKLFKEILKKALTLAGLYLSQSMIWHVLADRERQKYCSLWIYKTVKDILLTHIIYSDKFYWIIIFIW